MPAFLSLEMTEFNRLYKETDHIYTRYGALKGVSPTALYVLYALYTSPAPCTQTRLAEEWGMPMQTVNSCLKALEKSGDVRLTFAPGSRKSKTVQLTPQGQKMADEVVAPLVEAENRALCAMDLRSGHSCWRSPASTTGCCAAVY